MNMTRNFWPKWQVSPPTGTWPACPDQGPFLLQVTEVSGHQGNTWTLKTIQASLEDIIKQGTGILQRALTHGDLAVDAYTRRTRSVTGEILPVRLVPSADPNDRVFRLQVGGLPDSEGGNRVSDDLVIKKGDAEIRFHGDVDVSIELDTGLSYGLFRGLEYFKFVPEVGVTPNLSLTCTGKIMTERVEKKIYTIPFASIKFMAGLVPVWVSPAVDIYLGRRGQCGGGSEYGRFLQHDGPQRGSVHRWEGLGGD